MSIKKTELPANEQLNTQLYAGEENTHKETFSTQLVEREKIENSPFEIIGNKDHGYFAAFGKYRITEKFENMQLVKDYLESHKWEVVVNLILTLIDVDRTYREIDQKNKTT